MQRVWHLTIGDQRGGVFLSGIILVAVMTFLGVALFDLAAIEAALATNDAVSNQLLYCAEAALGRTMVDTGVGGRMEEIAAALQATPGGTRTWNETVQSGDTTCTNATTFTDDTAKSRRLLQATSTAPNGMQRSVRIQLNFLAAPFAYALVGNNGDFAMGGAGSVPSSGPGGADVINGDIFVAGRVLLGTPLSSCVGAGCGPSPKVNPRRTTDGNPTVSLPTGIAWTQTQADNSSAWPSAGDTNPFGYKPSMPQPDVTGYVGSVKAAVGMTAGNPTGNLTGTLLGTRVYNLSAIFSTLGANTDGGLRSPAGCTCGSGSGHCAVYCELQPLGVKLNPSDRATENASTVGADFYFDGVHSGEQFTSQSKTGTRGAQRLLDLAAVFAQPPIILADGNVWFHQRDDYGFAVNGRGTIVATNDLTLADNLIYKDGLTNTGSSTADMLGLVAQRDIWYGDSRYGTFVEGSGIMLAGRDFNFVFLDNSGNPRPPDNSIILNGTMLANRQVAVFRDFADPSASSSSATCSSQRTSCQPVRFDPDSTSCGSTSGCWRFLLRDGNGNLSFDTSKAAFRECGSSASSCGSGIRRISHFQMTLNYDDRLFTNPSLVPPGLPTGGGVNFANSWKDWQECPPCS
jgi:hypothetical protein